MPASSAKSSSPAKMTDTEAAQDTPPSSPPPADGADDGNPEDKSAQGVSATMREEEKRMQEASEKENEALEKRMEEQRRKDMQGGKGAIDGKMKALDYLLSQSKLYSTIMLQQMQKQEEADSVRDEKDRKRALKREEKAEQAAQDSQRRTTRRAVGVQEGGAGTDAVEDDNKDASSQAQPTTPKKGRGRPAKLKKEPSGRITDYIDKKNIEDKAGKGTTVQQALEEEAAAGGDDNDGVKASDVGVQNLKSARQPDLVSGGMMRGYQLEGLEWLTSLYENGLNGILADEMGLGKTVQTISFLAFLRERGTNGPFLIAAPLSTTSNWVDEFKRWTPSIPVMLYHGSKQEREELRRKKLRNPGSKDFPVVCTSYEICMNDRKFLAHYGWKFIIIDEGHRIKNLNCRLIRELQSYQSANRLLITGTPLQNNLSELWSLLHFLMPDIFDKLESFESWFDFSALKEKNGYEQIFSEEKKTSLVTSLHAILKPFLLRRVKADVEHSLPKKREYILYAPLTSEQRELYQEILNGNSRAYLEDKVVETISRTASGANTPASYRSSSSALKRKAAATSGTSTPNKSLKASRDSTPATNGTTASAKRRSGKKRQDYSEVSDREYFKKLEDGSNSANEYDTPNSSDQAETIRASTLALAKKQISQKKLQNPVMQLRLCCNSPHNFYDPFLDADDLDPSANATEDKHVDYTTLVRGSGKMQLLSILLPALLARGHKTLIFSQFKTTLDLLAVYLAEVLAEHACRIDGAVPAADRADQIRLFNASDAHNVFLLSTRAGGQGINLAAADTVILFDSDWNPQQDLQAQDRAHRIGQRRNVVVYRLATRGTVEEVLLERAEGKRRLEKLVIRKGKFRSWKDGGGKRKSQKGTLDALDGVEDADDDDVEVDEDGTIDELRALLGRGDGETFDFGAEVISPRKGKKGGARKEKQLLSDEDLEVLLDRSDEAYERAEKGLDKGGNAFKAVETKKEGEGGLLEAMTG